MGAHLCHHARRNLLEGLSFLSRRYAPDIPLPVEVLLPAFALGATLARPAPDYADPLDSPAESRVTNIVTACFMFLAGASILPRASLRSLASLAGAHHSLAAMGLHVLALTFLSNLGKMFPAFCYRRESGQDGRRARFQRSFRERIALGVCMFPRGEVGAGVLVIASAPAYNVSIVARSVTSLSLVMNLICTGFIYYSGKAACNANERNRNTQKFEPLRLIPPKDKDEGCL